MTGKGIKRRSVPAIEWPTVVLAFFCYGTWLAVGFLLWPSYPIPALAILGFVLALQSSIMHEVLHGHPTRNALVNEAFVFLPIGLVWPFRRFTTLHLRHHADERLTDPLDDPESYYQALWQHDDLPPTMKFLLKINNTMAGRFFLGPWLSCIGFFIDDAKQIMAGDRAIRAVADLGCETLLQTNAAGSLRLDMPPGSVMAISDHINFAGINPLFGSGPGDSRFVDMVDAYDPALLKKLLAAAREAKVTCHEGVYIFFSGPSFETPAEIRAARVLGADAVGMSTAPETILARHAGLKVVAFSLMTNYAAGLVPGALGHEQTLAVAGTASATVRRLLRTFLEQYD